MTDQAGEFAERVFGSILGAMEIGSIFLGDRLGFYRSLIDDGPATSDELASRTGVAERYAREWLEQQAAIGYLTVDDVAAEPHVRRFTLPRAHAEVLADHDSTMFLGGVPRMIASSFHAMPELLEAYRTGGGVSWARYGDDMWQGQGDTNRPLFMTSLAREWLPQIPAVDAALGAGGRVADVGCGTGWSSIAIALGYPQATVDGFDPDTVSVDDARVNAIEMGVADRVRFHDIDAAEAAGDSYDLVLAFECIHDMPYPVPVLASMRKLAGAAGTVLVVDERVGERFSAPAGDVERLMYGFSLTVCLPDGMAHPNSAGTGTVMRPDTLLRYATEAGFAGIEIMPIEHDSFRVYRLVT